jgi:hypothetical protein
MHLIIAFASAHSEAAAHTLRDLQLPHLAALLQRLAPARRLGSDEYSLTPPHERAWAQAIGLQGEDGALPLAALQAAGDGIATSRHAFGLLTPVHWSVGRDHISLADPHALGLDDAASRALFEAVRALFESEGIALHWGAPLRWYAAHDSLDGLACASIDRVIGRNVDLWLPSNPAARLMRRLQNEVQMLLYTHPITTEREAADQLAVNSFWLSGCGRAQAATPAAATLDTSLRAAVLAEDWAGWAEAWRALDAGALATLAASAARGEAVSLTLAGERFAQCYAPAARSLWQRLAGRWQAPPVAALLEAL